VVPAQPLAAKRASMRFPHSTHETIPSPSGCSSLLFIGGSLSWVVCTTLASTFALHRLFVSAFNVGHSSLGCLFLRVPPHQHNQHPQLNTTYILNATPTRSEGSNSARVAVPDVIVRAGSSEPLQNPRPILIPNTWCYLWMRRQFYWASIYIALFQSVS
jgi:hypothetical protein